MASAQPGMKNSDDKTVDLYIPRKCSWTRRLITVHDHAAIQVNVANLDDTGKYSVGDFKTYAISGYVRAKVSHLVESLCAQLLWDSQAGGTVCLGRADTTRSAMRITVAAVHFFAAAFIRAPALRAPSAPFAAGRPQGCRAASRL